MGDYREIQTDHVISGGDRESESTNIMPANSHENIALYDPGPQETTEENWDTWHGDNVLFSRGTSEGRTRCCRRCVTCGSFHTKTRKCLYFIFVCFILFLCILLVIMTVVLTGALSVKSSSTNKQKWYESAVGYQIFPRSFQDSDGDGVGDLKGIMNRLDHLQYIGIDVIWLSPINPSPYTHIGLDITNFTAVDPMLGDLENFHKLINAIHEKGMRLVLEFVPNHSSYDHDWFQESRKGKANPYSDLYIWADGRSEGEPPNYWKDAAGYSNWKYEHLRNQWYHHSFLKTEPSLNYDNDNVNIAMTDALRFWLQQGIDGLYIRHVNHLLGTSEIQADQNASLDLAAQNINGTRGRRDATNASFGNQERAKVIIRKWRQLVDEFQQSKNDQKLLVVDTYGSSLAFTASMYGTAEEPLAHYPFNYALFDVGNERTTGHTIRYLVDQWLHNRPKNAPTNWAFGSPEIARLATRYEPQFQAAITLLTLALPGSSLLYYGDEIGMTDAVISDKEVTIPYAPMQWDSSAYSGFTNGNDTWMDLANSSLTNNVEIQKATKSSTLNLIKRMIKLRHDEPALGNTSEEVHIYYLHSMRELVVFVRHPKKPSKLAGLLFIANVAKYEVTEDYTLIVKGTKLPDTANVVIATNDSLVGRNVNLKNLKLLSGEAVIVKFYEKPS